MRVAHEDALQRFPDGAAVLTIVAKIAGQLLNFGGETASSRSTYPSAVEPMTRSICRLGASEPRCCLQHRGLQDLLGEGWIVLGIELESGMGVVDYSGDQGIGLVRYDIPGR